MRRFVSALCAWKIHFKLAGAALRPARGLRAAGVLRGAVMCAFSAEAPAEGSHMSCVGGGRWDWERRAFRRIRRAPIFAPAASCHCYGLSLRRIGRVRFRRGMDWKKRSGGSRRPLLLERGACLNAACFMRRPAFQLMRRIWGERRICKTRAGGGVPGCAGLAVNCAQKPKKGLRESFFFERKRNFIVKLICCAAFGDLI